MSKYLKVFETLANRNSALPTVDFPNVSLIDSTGELKYARLDGNAKIIDSAFGDIIMCEESTGLLFNIKPADYELTDYPSADYKPIAVCICPRSARSDGYAVFMAVKWANPSYPGYGQKNPADGAGSMYRIMWGDKTRQISSLVDGVMSPWGSYNSKQINDKVKALDTTSWSTSSITNSTELGHFPAFEACWRFQTPGTQAGDWYLPSKYDLNQLSYNFDTWKASMVKIRTNMGTNYINAITNSDISPLYAWMANESDSGSEYGYTAYYFNFFDGTYYGRSDSTMVKDQQFESSSTWTVGVKPVMLAGVFDV